MTDRSSPSRARYRFDPPSHGVMLGLGQLRAAVLVAVLACGVALLYRGQPLLGAGLVLIGPIPVLWTVEDLPVIAWLVLKAHFRMQGAERRGWHADPELTAHIDPLTSRDEELA